MKHPQVRRLGLREREHGERWRAAVKGHFQLVGARGLQQVGEGDAGRGYVDDHTTVGGWPISLGPPDIIRAR